MAAFVTGYRKDSVIRECALPSLKRDHYLERHHFEQEPVRQRIASDARHLTLQQIIDYQSRQKTPLECVAG